MSNEISYKQCEHCGATWINGEHFWKTGKKSPNSELDLSGLVCNTHYGNPEKCINPKAGMEGGQTWEGRLKDLNVWSDKMNGNQ